tara:strand:+ start:44609 stop:45586 length:978 start_codon:yes stop_codon:yes gene_type:complete
MKKILLTGCAGFIGSNFLKKIAVIEREYEFVVLDLLVYEGSYSTIENDINDNDHISFVQLDIRNMSEINELFQKEKFCGVIHYAAESHVDASIKNPNIFVETNVVGTLNLLNASLRYGSESFRFCHVSTDEVYGDLSDDEEPFTEMNRIKPSSPYSASKAASDILVESYYKTYGLDCVITRCSNNYGPYQFPEKMIPLMIKNSLKGEKLPVYGTGKNIRDWIFVDDHNKGVWMAFKSGSAGEVYNFGGNTEKQNIEVVKQILNELNQSVDLITFVTDRKGHDWRYAMNYAKASRELGWTPSVDFEEGLRRTIKWYSENVDWLENF